jgi:hypothetical protein
MANRDADHSSNSAGSSNRISLDQTRQRFLTSLSRIRGEMSTALSFNTELARRFPTNRSQASRPTSLSKSIGTLVLHNILYMS